MASVMEKTGRAANPLFGANRLKLGTFATNVSNATAISTIEGALETTWPTTKTLALMADRAGFEAIVPVARWKGFGGQTDFNGRSFETYTWAAALGAVTERACIFSTSHVPTIHPIVAAKQATTIDHVTGGRFALNIVCGWFAPELEMFGAPIMDHERRYAYADEWLEVVKRLWTEQDEFDFSGRFFTIRKGFHQPKPIQKPYPAVMNAGGSQTGWEFMTRTCDIGFTQLRDRDAAGMKAQVERMRALAAAHGREMQIWSAAYVVQGDSDAEAQAFLDHYAGALSDREAVDNMTSTMVAQDGDRWTPEQMAQFKFHFGAGYGGYPLVGSAATILEHLETIAEAGVDGLVLSWVRYEEGLARWIADVLPLMERAGLRRPA